MYVMNILSIIKRHRGIIVQSKSYIHTIPTSTKNHIHWRLPMIHAIATPALNNHATQKLHIPYQSLTQSPALSHPFSTLKQKRTKYTPRFLPSRLCDLSRYSRPYRTFTMHHRIVDFCV